MKKEFVMSVARKTRFFTTTSIAQVDIDGKLTLGFPLKQENVEQSYRVLVNDAGQILLDPFTNIPKQEIWLWKNPEALASLEHGLQQSASGDLHDLGSFAKYSDLELED